MKKSRYFGITLGNEFSQKKTRLDEVHPKSNFASKNLLLFERGSLLVVWERLSSLEGWLPFLAEALAWLSWLIWFVGKSATSEVGGLRAFTICASRCGVQWLLAAIKDVLMSTFHAYWDRWHLSYQLINSGSIDLIVHPYFLRLGICPGNGNHIHCYSMSYFKVYITI